MIIDSKLKMKVRTRCPTRLSNCADHLSLFDALSRLHVDLTQVRVDRCLGVTVVYEHNIPKTVHPTRGSHHSLADGVHWGSRGGSVVDPLMGFPCLLNRMKAHFVTARDAGVSKRRSQVDAFEALTLQVKVPTLFG